MLRLTPLELALRALAIAFVISAITALVLPPSVPARAAAPAELDTRTAPDGAGHTADPAVTTAIVAGNIFSSSRTPPAARYQPFAEVDVPAPVFDPVAAAPTDPEEAVPRLFGIVAGPAGTAALLRLDAAAPEAELLREGDTSGRYRVLKINEHSVVLSGPAGRVELRLKRPEG